MSRISVFLKVMIYNIKMKRNCYVCGEPINACMGFVIAGDFMEFMQGKRDNVREICAKDALRYEENLICYLQKERDLQQN